MGCRKEECGQGKALFQTCWAKVRSFRTHSQQGMESLEDLNSCVHVYVHVCTVCGHICVRVTCNVPCTWMDTCVYVYMCAWYMGVCCIVYISSCMPV